MFAYVSLPRTESQSCTSRRGKLRTQSLRCGQYFLLKDSVLLLGKKEIVIRRQTSSSPALALPWRFFLFFCLYHNTHHSNSYGKNASISEEHQEVNRVTIHFLRYSFLASVDI